jgi:hypothetical protein
MSEYTSITRIRPIAGSIARPEVSVPKAPDSSAEHQGHAGTGSVTTALGSLVAGLVIRRATSSRGR